MRKTLFYVAFPFMLLGSSCIDTGTKINGNGNQSSVVRQVGNSPRIKVISDIDVFLNEGEPAVKVEADENLIPYIETTQEGGWLVIKTREHTNLRSSNPIRVYVTTKNLEDLEVTGSGNVTGNNKFSSGDDMSFKITGSGDVKMNVNTPKIEAGITGSGNLNLEGETKNIKISITGSGDYDGPDLKAENAEVSISGSGNATIFADDKLKASVMGSGEVKYKGNADVETHVSGSGTVSKIH